MHAIRRWIVSSGLVAVLGVGALSCSGGPESTDGSSAEPRAGSSGAPNVNLGAGSVGGAPSAGGTAACSVQTRAGKRVPLDMYFLVDSSGSMADYVDRGNKWELVTGALIDFLSDPRNAEVGTGIGYFPETASSDCSNPSADCICLDFLGGCFSTSGGSCAAVDYAQPAVPLTAFPNADRVIGDLQSRWVEGGTPTRPAVEGALQYLNDWASRHPERQPVLVLATDGEPTDCDANTPEDVAAVAANAVAGPQAIRTFVIGLGYFPESLDFVARAGGTERAFLVDTAGDVATAFADALDAIRGAASSCDFVIPTESTAGQKLDPHRVNVRHTPAPGASSLLVPQVFQNDPKNCGAADGWYYDDPAAPSLIRLCPATCRASNDGDISIELGCETIVQRPR